jgi:fructose-1-phosphate kinase PfkB-like protein
VDCLGRHTAYPEEDGKVELIDLHIQCGGAGDVYHGAYIYGLLRGWGMRECMRFASVAAALECRQIGARKGIPRLAEVERFLSISG